MSTMGTQRLWPLLEWALTGGWWETPCRSLTNKTWRESQVSRVSPYLGRWGRLTFTNYPFLFIIIVKNIYIHSMKSQSSTLLYIILSLIFCICSWCTCLKKDSLLEICHYSAELGGWYLWPTKPRTEMSLLSGMSHLKLMLRWVPQAVLDINLFSPWHELVLTCTYPCWLCLESIVHFCLWFFVWWFLQDLYTIILFSVNWRRKCFAYCMHIVGGCIKGLL